MNKNEENELIIDALNLLNGNCDYRFKDRKPHLKKIIELGKTHINGFDFSLDTWCWLVWKPMNFKSHPEYKGVSLVKIIPRYVEDEDNIEAILNAQPWMYV